MANEKSIIFLPPTEIMEGLERTTGIKQPGKAWKGLAAAFGEQGRRDRQAGKEAVDGDFFLIWAGKRFGQQNAGPVAALLQGYYMGAYNLEHSRTEKVCANCEHFYQHYGFEYGQYHPINCGHCTYPRLKNRKPGDTCEHFTRAGAHKRAASACL